MSEFAPTPSEGPRCRRAPRPLAPGAVRPTDLLGAFFLVAIAFLVAGGVAGALDTAGAIGWYGHWLALHLVFLGGVSLLVLGAGQFFTTAYLATDPPGRRMVRAQLALWVTGTVLVAVAVPARADTLSDVGGAGIVAALALFAVSLWQLERRSLQQARWAVRWYYACAAFLAAGAIIGLLMARGTAWSHGSLLGAHLALNLAGWLGTAIVGTLHTFFPSLTHSRLGHPRLQGPTFSAWTGGVLALGVGAAFSQETFMAGGWIALALAAVLLAVNLVASARAAVGPIGLAPRLVGTGQVFLVAGLAVAVGAIVADGPRAPLEGDARPALAVLLLAGWVAMTVSGSLLHLLAVLHRVRNLARAMPTPTPGRDTALTALAACAIAALAASYVSGLEGLGGPARLAAAGVVALLGARILALAARAARSLRVRI